MAENTLWQKIEKKYGSKELPDLKDPKTLASVHQSTKKDMEYQIRLQDTLRKKSLERSLTKVI